ncbi:inlI [Symbiodinium natans]|uniref:InlI protein n=1 Tax=Symbiodinium natans TaxID=878477 RepID=A0A812P5U7_9DINO|nr:inlI [Symbiodinium natans]
MSASEQEEQNDSGLSQGSYSPRLDENALAEEDAGAIAESGMQLDEFIAQLGAWGSAMEENMQQTMWESALEAERLEQQLQERPAPPDIFFEVSTPHESLPLLDLGEQEDPGREAIELDSGLEEVNSFLAQMAAEARSALQEERVKLFSRGGPGEQSEKVASEESLQPAVHEEAEASVELRSAPLADSSNTGRGAPVAETLTLPAETAQLAAFDSSAEALQSIEDERLACLEELEREHEAFVEQMRQEEEDIRCEEVRVREEVRMHREELLCREFYREESTAQRRDRRKMWIEDKHSSHVRDEERQMLENAERAKEAAERQRFAAEEALAAAIRRRDHERREAATMAAEDELSAAWREALRLTAESQRFAAADAESFLWREICREAAESRQMASEDQRSSMLRLCDFKPVVPIDRQVACPVDAVAPDLSVLAQMVMPGPPKPTQQDHHEGSSWPAQFNNALNPWDSSSIAEPAVKSGMKSKEATTCGSLMCLQLWEGNSRCKGPTGKGFNRKRPPKPWSRPPDDQKSEQPGRQSISEDLGLDGLAGLEDGGSAVDLVRLEIRMEGLEQLPALSRVPHLRILVLSGNKISNLEDLRGCPKLEELVLCQNALTSLDGLRHLRHLSVLKATMNAITDAEDLAQLPQLRVVDLSKNRLTSVQLCAKGLGKLVLYRNSLHSATFLRELPSLTQLDLGRNKLTELDSAISEWNPVLTKAFLYENCLASLPELHLPLLTDLWVDNNLIEQLGPLGFLPSLERLQAKHNRIRKLSFPVAASPLLRTLELAFNQLDRPESYKAVVPFARLTRLQLNDNPLAAEMMEEYRPWVLRMAPQLEELDNETVNESERRELDLKGFGQAGQAKAATSLTERSWPTSPFGDKAGLHAEGLLGLVGADVAMSRRPQICPTSPPDQNERCAGRSTGISWHQAVVDRWKAGWKMSGDIVSEESGCPMCALAAWCEMLNAARSAPFVAHTRDERRTAALLSSCETRAQRLRRCEALFALRRRHDFWTAYLQLCFTQYDWLVPWRAKQGAVCRRAAFELQIPGSERSCQTLILKVQSRWRGVLARRAAARLCLERVCEAISPGHLRCINRFQAMWRGHSSRNNLRARGMVLPGDKHLARLKQAATQLQAALRGSRVRRKLRWAKEVSRMANDDLEDCPEVDLEEMLSEARSVANADPFGSLSLPPLKEVPQAFGITHQNVNVAAPEPLPRGPMVAWTQQSIAPGAPPAPATIDVVSESGSVVGSPHSSRPGSGFGIGPRRSRSLSSTAESAMTEPDGQGTRSRAEQAKDEWGFQDISTARACLAAQKRRQPRPPTLPGHGPLRSSAGRQPAANLAQARKQPSSQSAGPAKRGGGCQKAQDAIAEYRRLQEAEAAATSTSVPTEFRTGSPNRKLMRSSQSLG